MTIVSFAAGKSSINVLGDMLSNNKISSVQIDKLSVSNRITKAANSVAESAVGVKLKRKVDVLKSVLSNAFQTKSVLEIAENSMAKMGDVMTKMTSIALQAANSVLTNEDREKIDTEFQALKEGLDKIYYSANFNGEKIFQGDADKFFIGKKVKELGILSVRYKNRESVEQDVYFEMYTESWYDKPYYPIHKMAMSGYIMEIAHGARGKIGEIQEIYFPELGIIAVTKNEGVLNSKNDYESSYPIYIDPDFPNNDDSDIVINLSMSGNNGRLYFQDSNNETYYSESFNFLNNKPLYNGRSVTFTSEKDQSKKVIVIVKSSSLPNLTTDGTTSVEDAYTTKAKFRASYIMMHSHKIEFSVQLGDNEKNKIELKLPFLNSKFLGLTNKHVNVKDADNLQEVLRSLQFANSQIQDARGKIGATQNRLDFAVSDMQTTIINSEAAYSAMFDLDVSSSLVDLSTSELNQVSESEVLARDIRERQELLKLFS